MGIYKVFIGAHARLMYALDDSALERAVAQIFGKALFTYREIGRI